MKDFSEEVKVGDSEFTFVLPAECSKETTVSYYEMTVDGEVLWRMEDGVMVYERDKE